VYLTKEQINAIEKVLADGDRVELIPVKDGIKIVRIKRNNVACS
jgi:hypothetical protein